MSSTLKRISHDIWNSIPAAREWDELMRTYQEPVPERKPEEWWALMECVFEL